MKNKSHKKNGVFFYNIFVTALCMYVQYTPRVLYGSTQRVVDFFFSKHRGNQKVSVPLMSHLYPWWNVDFFLCEGFNIF